MPPRLPDERLAKEPDEREAGRRQSDVWASWEDAAQAALVSEMRRRKISYKELSRRLEALGIDETPDRINRKVNRKRFSAAFLLACLKAMGVESLPVDGSPGTNQSELAKPTGSASSPASGELRVRTSSVFFHGCTISESSH